MMKAILAILVVASLSLVACSTQTVPTETPSDTAMTGGDQAGDTVEDTTTGDTTGGDTMANDAPAEEIDTLNENVDESATVSDDITGDVDQSLSGLDELDNW